jgi:hypothetical protein
MADKTPFAWHNDTYPATGVEFAVECAFYQADEPCLVVAVNSRSVQQVLFTVPFSPSVLFIVREAQPMRRIAVGWGTRYRSTHQIRVAVRKHCVLLRLMHQRSFSIGLHDFRPSSPFLLSNPFTTGLSAVDGCGGGSEWDSACSFSD